MYKQNNVLLNKSKLYQMSLCVGSNEDMCLITPNGNLSIAPDYYSNFMFTSFKHLFV